MKLEELEFKAEDLKPIYGTVVDDVMLNTLVNLVNTILREKLEKAPEVGGRFVTRGNDKVEYTEFLLTDKPYTHKARLVCIEELHSSSGEGKENK